MTISSEDDPRAGPYTGTDAQTAFPFSFKCVSKNELLVVLADEEGEESTLVLDSDYSVTLNGDQDTNPGGTITYPVSGDPLTTDETLTIESDVPYTQPVDITNGGAFNASIIETALDRQTMLAKQTNTRVSRTLQLAISSPEGVDARLPIPEAGSAIGWDALGTTLVNIDLSEGQIGVVIGDLANDSNTAKGAALVGWRGRTVGDKLDEAVSVNDYSSQALAEAAVLADDHAVLFNNVTPFTITVGGSGEAATINEAIEIAVRMRPLHKAGNTPCVIQLLSGFVMNEQVLLDGGVDLGWIKLTSVASTVDINPAGLTTPLVSNDNSYPAFGAKNNSTMLTIAVQFVFQAGGATSRHGLELYWGSKCQMMPGSGFRDAPGRAISALFNSHVYCYPDGITSSGVVDDPLTNRGVDCSGAASRALYVAFGSRAHLARSNFDDAGGNAAVYVIYGGWIDIYQSYVRDAAETAVEVRDGSWANCRIVTVARAGQHGFHCYHGSHINARWLDDVIGTESAQDCGATAVLCNTGSSMECDGLNVSGSANGFSCLDGSRMDCLLTFADDCTAGVGYTCRASVLHAADSSAENCTTGYSAEEAGILNANNSTADGCTRGYETIRGGIINCEDSTAIGCTDRGVSALGGGTVNCRACNLSGAGTFGITARDGSRVEATGVDCTGAGGTGIDVRDGGAIINARSSTGTLSQTAQTVTAHGIIFKA